MNLLKQSLRSISIVKNNEEEERFQSNNTCWICEKPINNDDKKVRDYCHVTEKYRGAAHWSCKMFLQLCKRRKKW